MGFLPQENKFFDLFEAQTQKVIEAVELFKTLRENYDNLPWVTRRLKEVEDEADTIVHNIGNLVDRTFITPLDREDIRPLSHEIDNLIDNLEAAVFRLSISEIKTLPPVVMKFSEILSQIAEEIKKAVACLRNIGKRGKILYECCIKINELENDGDALHRAALKEIAESKPKSATELLQLLNLKEIVSCLETAADESEDVANILEAIRTKYS